MKISTQLMPILDGGLLACDLHTHTWRCQHAEGDVADYLLAADKAGLRVLATTDHGPISDGRWSNFRMRWDELDSYFQAAAVAQELSKVRLLRGLELEYIRELTHRDLAEITSKYPLQVWRNTYSDIANNSDVKDFLCYLIDGASSRLFDIVAHPDLFTRFATRVDSDTIKVIEEFAQSCIEHGVCIELNANEHSLNPRSTSYFQFWNVVAESRAPVIINSDAHSPAAVNRGRAEVRSFANGLGITLFNPA
jgi:histidinol-phosphatase (PHP family)